MGAVSRGGYQLSASSDADGAEGEGDNAGTEERTGYMWHPRGLVERCGGRGSLDVSRLCSTRAVMALDPQTRAVHPLKGAALVWGYDGGVAVGLNGRRGGPSRGLFAGRETRVAAEGLDTAGSCQDC